MATIVTRSGKGSPLTNNEVDANFTNLNTELGTKANTSSLATVATTGAYADLTGKPTLVDASNVAITGGSITGTTIDSITNHVGADHIHYKIKATQILAKGDVVKVVGFNAGENAFEVAKVSASTDIAVGVVYSALASGALGSIINTGLLEGIDTSAYAIGTTLYPNTSGGFTSTKPTSGRYQALAFVVRSNANNGTILIEASEPQSTSLSQFTNDSGYITGINSGNVTTALGYTPANRAGDTFTGPITVNSGANQAILGSDGAIELTRGAGGAYIDFKDSTAEDFDVRLQASGSQLNISAAGGLTLNGAGVLTGITSGQVTTALGYTPYNATNPAGYITSAGSISGNAATATNISNTGTVTLASATESNSIYATAPSYTADQPTKLLNFDWYSNVFSIGNIRGGSTNSNGFGVYYTASGGSRSEIARFLTNGNLGLGNVSPQSRFTIGSAQGNSLEFTYSSDNAYRNIIANYWNSGADTRMDFNIGRTGNVAPVTVMSVGYNSNVGVGTTEPAGRIHSVSTSAFTAPNLLCTDTVSNFRIVFNTGAYAGVPANKPWLHSYDDIYIGSDANVTTRFMSGGATNLAVASTGIVTAATAFNAPVFTDSLNSAYYVDPNGNSNISQLMTTGAVVIGGVFANNSYGTAGARLLFGGGNEPDTYFIGTNIENYGGNYSKLDLRWHTGIRIGAQPSYGGVRFYDTEALGTQIFAIGKDGSYAQANQSMRAPVFYDLDNTTYYIDPASGSNLIGQVQINGGTTMSGGWNRALYLASQFPVIVMNSGSVKYSGIGVDYSEAQSGMVFWVNGNSADITNGSATAALRINTGNYVVANDFRAAIFYDSNDTAYYINPNSSGTSAVFAGDIHINDTTWGADKALRFREGASDTYGGFIKYTAGDSLELGTRNNSTTDTRAIYISRGANWAGSDGSFRAPIFYDSENTAYYVDPNGGSRTGGITADSLQSLGNLTVNSGLVYRSDWTTRFQSGSDFTSGTLVTTDIPATGFAGESFVIEITGKSYSATNLPFKVVAQGYLYNDTIINYTGISYGGDFATYIKVFEEGGVLKFWWPRISYWNSFNVNVMAMDGATNNTITRNRVTAIGNSTEPTGTKKQQINLIKTLKTGDAAGSISGFNNPTTAPTANTIVYRDAAGDISAREIVLSSGLSAQTPTVLVSMYPTTNQLVRTTPAAVAAAIQGAASGSWGINVTGTAAKATDLAYPRYTNNDFNTLGGAAPNGFRAYTNYIPSGGSYNQPPNGAGDYKVLQFGDLSEGSSLGNWGGQIVMNFYDDRMWFRRSSSTTWQSWREFIHDGNYTSYAMPSGASATNSVDVRAPIFYDSNDTSRYIDPNSGGVALRTSGYWLADTTAWAGDINGKIQYHDNSWYISAANQWVFRASSGAEPFRVTQGGIAIAALDMRAPLFYDNNDTAYFIDPNSTSRLSVANVNFITLLNDEGLNVKGIRGQFAAGSDGQGISMFSNVDIGYPSGWGSGLGNTPSRGLSVYGGLRVAYSGGGFITSDTSVRSPVFYDSDNTAFYTSPNTTSNVSEMVSYSYRGNGNVGGTGSASWHPSGIYSAGYNWLYGGISAGGGDITAVNEVYANRYYDSGNTAFYVDPASTSNLSGLTVSSRISGSISGDAQRLFNHTGANNDGLQYWNTVGNDTLNPNTGWHYAIRMGHGDADTYYSATIAVDFFNDNVWLRRKGGGANQPWKRFALYENPYALPFYANVYYDADNSAYYLDASSTGTSLNVAGSIIAAGNVTAYSDIRIKANVETIPSALDKLDLIRGVTYTRTDLDDKEQRYAGVIAQEIEAVLPEAVRDLGDIKAVDYNATIALLIQAVKELRDEVEMLRK